jgi:hypothetical protein
MNLNKHTHVCPHTLTGWGLFQGMFFCVQGGYKMILVDTVQLLVATSFF